jgi:hypothetical protein
MNFHVLIIKRIIIFNNDFAFIGADAFSSTALGIGLIMNSYIPNGLGIKLKGKEFC